MWSSWLASDLPPGQMRLSDESGGHQDKALPGLEHGMAPPLHPEHSDRGASAPEATGTARLALTGMHCSSCVALIEEALTESAGVTRAEVDLDSASARVTFDPTIVSFGDLCAVVIGEGYGATACEESSS
jgi:copper chaperone CopZ